MGPATGDSCLKPNVTAPGVSIFSAGMGTGNGAAEHSGTSMAAPHTTGMAALVKQAHPDWRKVKYWEAAIENTADPGMVTGYATRGAGTGLRPGAAGRRRRRSWRSATSDTATLNFGFNELDRDFSETEDRQADELRQLAGDVQRRRRARRRAARTRSSFTRRRVTVPAHGERDVPVRLTVPAATAGGASLPAPHAPFSDVVRPVTFTPVGGSNNGVTLRVPYYMVPQARLERRRTRRQRRDSCAKTGTATATVTNELPAARSPAPPTGTRGASRTSGPRPRLERPPGRRRPVLPGGRRRSSVRDQHEPPLVERRA